MEKSIASPSTSPWNRTLVFPLYLFPFLFSISFHFTFALGFDYLAD